MRHGYPLFLLLVACGGSATVGRSPSASSQGAAEDIADAGEGPLPARGGVTLNGGSVDRLYFAMTGDTRPPLCDLFLLGSGNDYPSAVISQLAQQMEAQQTQFVLDLGDHMFVCFGGASEAQSQMSAYTAAISPISVPYFMSMGNHECAFALGGSLDDCGADNPGDPVFTTFMGALAPVSPLPYYARDIQTSQGLARFVFVADDAWNDSQSAWLESTLADADQNAKYTIIARHHNLAASTSGNYAAIVSIIQAHKYALHLTAHEHTYLHDTVLDPSGRTAVVGTGGSNDATMNGYATVVQGLDGNLYFTMYDSSTNAPVDAWTVGPN